MHKAQGQRQVCQKLAVLLLLLLLLLHVQCYAMRCCAARTSLRQQSTRSSSQKLHLREEGTCSVMEVAGGLMMPHRLASCRKRSSQCCMPSSSVANTLHSAHSLSLCWSARDAERRGCTARAVMLYAATEHGA